MFMKTITIKIEGMMCGHCENRVKNAVMALDGVESCEASAKENQAVICFDESKLKENNLKEAIEEIGYEVK